MSVKQIGPQEAHDILASDPQAVYVDVRTEQEFRNGHVPGAKNIVAFVPDPSTNRMAPNPEFLKTFEAAVAKDTRIIVGCQAGGRSQQAALILEHAGFTDISNMKGGFGGARDPMGQVITPDGFNPTFQWNGEIGKIEFVKFFAIARALVGFYFRTVPRDWMRRAPFLPVPPRTYIQWRMRTAYGKNRPAWQETLRDLWQFGDWLRHFPK